MKGTITAVLAVFLFSTFPQYVMAQCPGCSLNLRKLVELDSEQGDFAPSMEVSVARFSSGEYAVSYRFGEPVLALYGTDGNLVRVHDRTGKGPGELTSDVTLVLGRADTLYAFERRRLHRFYRGLAHLDTRVFPSANVWEPLIIDPDGNPTFSTLENRPGGNVITIGTVSADSVAALETMTNQRRDTGELTVFAAAGADGVWTIPNNGSALRYLKTSWQRVSERPVNRPWFQPWTTRVDGEGFSVAPRPKNTWLAETPNGCVLLATSIAKTSWKSPLNADGRFRPREVDPSALYDTMLELIDPASGNILAALRSALSLRPVYGASQVTSTRQDELGNVTVDVWAVDAVVRQASAGASCRRPAAS